MIITIGTGNRILRLNMILIAISFSGFAVISCRHKTDGENVGTTGTIVPVKYVHPEIRNMENYLDLNGTSMYLGKEIVRSTVTGYVNAVKKNIGEKVLSGEKIFVIRTKESAALQEFTDSTKDPHDIQFSGLIPILAHQNGVVSNIDYHTGSYVHEGDILATVLQPKTIVFQINVPYEYHHYIKIGEPCHLIFPGKMLKHGHISKVLPTVDPLTQTQKFFVTLEQYKLLPENLKVIVKLPVSRTKKALVLPRDAVLCNETQTNFWIMKIIHDSLASKIPVIPGIVSGDTIEIISPQLSLTDTIITEGNYGLEDSTVVMITNK